MKRRSKTQWLSLIEEFEQSNQTQSAFCAERGLNPKYFSLRRAKFKADEGDSPFARAVVPNTVEQVTIQYGRVTISLPASAAQTIAHLVKVLAA